MLNISISEDCTHAPNKQYVRDFNVDCITGRIADALDKLTDDIRWHVVGHKVMKDKVEISENLRAMHRSEIMAFSIDNAIAQDRRVVANGTLELKNGSKVKFCDIYLFDGHGVQARIKHITTYSVAVK